MPFRIWPRSLSCFALGLWKSIHRTPILPHRVLQDGTERASGTIQADQPNYEALVTDTSFRVAKSVWYDVALPTPITLTAGQTWDVEFQPEGDSQWVFSVSRNGSTNGFSWPAAFTESHAEHQQDGQWINANHFAHYSSGRGDTNWPVVLHQGQ